MLSFHTVNGAVPSSLYNDPYHTHAHNRQSYSSVPVSLCPVEYDSQPSLFPPDNLHVTRTQAAARAEHGRHLQLHTQVKPVIFLFHLPLQSSISLAPLPSSFSCVPLLSFFSCAPLQSSFNLAPLSSTFSCVPLLSSFSCAPLQSSFSCATLPSSFTTSSSFRQQMLEMLFSGKFPSPTHKNTYTGELHLASDYPPCLPEDLRNVPDDPGSHEDRARYQEIKV